MYNKIFKTSKTVTKMSDLPDDILATIRTSLEAYFENYDDEDEESGTIVVQSDGSIERKKINYKLRDAIEDEFTQEELKSFSRYSIDGVSTIVVPGNTELTIVDENSYMEDYVHTIGDQTVPLHYQVYYRINANPEKEEVVLIDAMLHTHTYAEYLKYS